MSDETEYDNADTQAIDARIKAQRSKIKDQRETVIHVVFSPNGTPPTQAPSLKKRAQKALTSLTLTANIALTAVFILELATDAGLGEPLKQSGVKPSEQITKGEGLLNPPPSPKASPEIGSPSAPNEWHDHPKGPSLQEFNEHCSPDAHPPLEPSEPYYPHYDKDQNSLQFI